MSISLATQAGLQIENLEENRKGKRDTKTTRQNENFPNNKIFQYETFCP
jgi:hypothetical protein